MKKIKFILLLIVFFLFYPLYVSALTMDITSGTIVNSNGIETTTTGTINYNWIQGGAMDLFDYAPSFTICLNGYDPIDIRTGTEIWSELFGIGESGAAFAIRDDGWDGEDQNYYITGNIDFDGQAAPYSSSASSMYQDIFVQAISFNLLTGPQTEFTFKSLDICASIRPVPEPSTILLFGFGILGIAGAGRKKVL